MSFDIFSQVAYDFATLQAHDALTVATLAVLEGLLSVDNSLVLAILVKGLPPKKRRRALTYGIVGAFAFRILALIFAVYMMKLTIFKLLGGLYLVYLAMKHLFFFSREDAHQTRTATERSFWKTVLVVEFTDIAFSIDSITTAVAMSDKLLIIWLGGILGIVFLRYAATLFIRLLEKLPTLEDLAFQLIFFIGTKLLLEGFHIEISQTVFWIMFAVILILGTALVYKDHHQRSTRSRFHERLLIKLKEHAITVDDVLALDYIPRDVLAVLIEEGHLAIQRKPGHSQ
jgi:YkoY family integral membrane protein